jgi:hypothetical protein
VTNVQYLAQPVPPIGRDRSYLPTPSTVRSKGHFLGSMAGHALNAPIVGWHLLLAVGAQYYEVDGGIFSFGGAPFLVRWGDIVSMRQRWAWPSVLTSMAVTSRSLRMTGYSPSAMHRSSVQLLISTSMLPSWAWRCQRQHDRVIGSWQPIEVCSRSAPPPSSDPWPPHTGSVGNGRNNYRPVFTSRLDPDLPCDDHLVSTALHKQNWPPLALDTSVRIPQYPIVGKTTSCRLTRTLTSKPTSRLRPGFPGCQHLAGQHPP